VGGRRTPTPALNSSDGNSSKRGNFLRRLLFTGFYASHLSRASGDEVRADAIGCYATTKHDEHSAFLEDGFRNQRPLAVAEA
jgi:hypothetical protein